MIESLKRAFDRGTGAELFECRDCGTGVDNGATECPTCGSDEIATYSI